MSAKDWLCRTEQNDSQSVGKLGIRCISEKECKIAMKMLEIRTLRFCSSYPKTSGSNPSVLAKSATAPSMMAANSRLNVFPQWGSSSSWVSEWQNTGSGRVQHGGLSIFPNGGHFSARGWGGGGVPGGEVGCLFKDQTRVFGQTQVIDPPVMNDKTPPNRWSH